MLDKFLQMDDSHEFKPVLSEIEDSPSSPYALFMFWIIVALIIVTIGWLIIGKVDIVISSRGKVIPDGEIKILQPLDTGSIKRIMVKEGDYVKKGQILAEIDPSTTEPQLESTIKNLGDINLEIQRLQASAQGTPFIAKGDNPEAVLTQQELYISSLNSLNEQLQMKNNELNRVQQDINASITETATYQGLLNRAHERKVKLDRVINFIARDEYERLMDEIENYTGNIKRTNYKLKGMDEQKSSITKEISYIKENFKTQNLKELADKQKQATELSAKLDQINFMKLKQNIISPVDGYVDKLFIHTVGGVVTPAEKIIAITPSNVPLLIKATILNKDIGFVKENMPVQLKIDTFSFQKYGLLDGVVKTVSKTSIDDEKLGPVYEVYIKPTTKTLMVEGKEESITSGMSLSAEIKVGKRRIIEFFIYPLIKYLNEGISVK